MISTQDRTINFLEAPVTELLIGATAVSLSLMEIQRQIIELIIHLHPPRHHAIDAPRPTVPALAEPIVR